MTGDTPRTCGDHSLNVDAGLRQCDITGCEAGLPSAIGPPPPLRVGAKACDAMTLRDNPAKDAGRSAMFSAPILNQRACDLHFQKVFNTGFSQPTILPKSLISFQFEAACMQVLYWPCAFKYQQ